MLSCANADVGPRKDQTPRRNLVLRDAINHMKAGDDRSAIDLLKDATKPGARADVDVGRAHELLGRAYQRVSQHEDALESFKRALARIKDDVGLYRSLAASAEAVGDVDRVLVPLRRACHTTLSKSFGCWELLGTIASRNERFKEGRAHFLKAVDLRPGLKRFFGKGNEAVRGLRWKRDNMQQRAPWLNLKHKFIPSNHAALLRRIMRDALTARAKLDPLLCLTTGSDLALRIESESNAPFASTDGGYKCVNASALPSHLVTDLQWSSSVFVKRGTIAAIDQAEDKIAKQLGLHQSRAFQSQLLMYPPGAGYEKHTDCNFRLAPHSRDVTALVYLSTHTGQQGGETVFPKPGMRVTAREGQLALFMNIDDQGFCRSERAHLSRPLSSSSEPKFVLQKVVFPVARRRPQLA